VGESGEVYAVRQAPPRPVERLLRAPTRGGIGHAKRRPLERLLRERSPEANGPVSPVGQVAPIAAWQQGRPQNASRAEHQLPHFPGRAHTPTSSRKFLVQQDHLTRCGNANQAGSDSRHKVSNAVYASRRHTPGMSSAPRPGLASDARFNVPSAFWLREENPGVQGRPPRDRGRLKHATEARGLQLHREAGCSAGPPGARQKSPGLRRGQGCVRRRRSSAGGPAW